jgi:hemerythrin
VTLLWREQLSVGNNVIDADHKFLIEIINHAEYSLKTKNKAELDEALESLAKYSRAHFDREEKIADAAGYSQVPHLSESHHDLLKQLDQVSGELDAMGRDWSSATIDHFTNFLRGWLINHVIKEDLLMKPVLNKFSPSFDPR